MPLQATSGAASYDAFGGGAAAVPAYIEDVFSTYLYTGNGSTQTINNGIDLSTKGGMLWCKIRNTSDAHALFDTARGFPNWLVSNTTGAQNAFGVPDATDMVATTTGFSMKNISSASNSWNSSGNTFASWTFRKQPKFFDVVTWTGNGASSRAISHALNATVGCILVKITNGTGDWNVWHRSNPNTSNNTGSNLFFLNTTDAVVSSSLTWGGQFPTNTSFYVGGGDTNSTSLTYVAYIFAHDAGGFGLTGTDNVISCGSYTGNGSSDGPVVTLGYEPQWVMIKRATGGTGDWLMFDNMRGITPAGADDKVLLANSSGSEYDDSAIELSATGFKITGATSQVNTNTNTYIYIAIRRGPMKVPSTGTSVFGLSARSGTGANATVTGGQTDDAVLVKNRGSAVASLFASRLTGKGYLVTSSTAAEVSAGTTILQANPWDVMDGVKVGTTSTITNASGNTYINYLFRRAPSFFDVVCYTGTGATDRDVAHNLGVIPEAIIIKSRSSATYSWGVRFYGSGNTDRTGLALNNTLDAQNAGFGTTGLSGTTFNPYYVAGNNGSNASNFGDNAYNLNGTTYVAYLFATCAGVSKVGSYTGTATTKQIDCGFTAGARFVLIKRTDSTGDWYVWDTARGIVSGNDSYLLLNSTAAEVTNTDYIDTYSAGFEISSTAPAAINASGGSFIFFAVA
jgi:hypothetical protein